MAADTIAAIATASGPGGVGIIRVSGPAAEAVLRRVAPGLAPELASHRMVLTRVVAGGEVVDQALAVLMRAPRSYTGEDVAELHAHGGAVNLRRVLEAVLAAGARAAEPGEFTRRAFEAGRIDLARAEAVAGVVAAAGERALRVAQAQLFGKLTERVRELRAEVVRLLAEVEATIDFPGEGLEMMGRPEMARRAAAVAAGAGALAASYRAGRVLRDGLEVALVGAANAGKSSLLNALAGRERAVVSAEPGTTRDFLEARMSWDGVAVTLIDTPGERGEVGVVEGRGLELARARVAQADVRVVVVDAAGDGGGDGDVVALSKCDLGGAAAARARVRAAVVVETSALTGAGLPELRAAVLAAGGVAADGDDAVVVTSARQRELFEAAAAAAAAASTAGAEELVAADLRVALARLGEVLGEGVGEDVIDAVFARFCIGK